MTDANTSWCRVRWRRGRGTSAETALKSSGFVRTRFGTGPDASTRVWTLHVSRPVFRMSRRLRRSCTNEGGVGEAWFSSTHVTRIKRRATHDRASPGSALRSARTEPHSRFLMLAGCGGPNRDSCSGRQAATTSFFRLYVKPLPSRRLLNILQPSTGPHRDSIAARSSRAGSRLNKCR